MNPSLSNNFEHHVGVEQLSPVALEEPFRFGKKLSRPVEVVVFPLPLSLLHARVRRGGGKAT